MGRDRDDVRGSGKLRAGSCRPERGHGWSSTSRSAREEPRQLGARETCSYAAWMREEAPQLKFSRLTGLSGSSLLMVESAVEAGPLAASLLVGSQGWAIDLPPRTQRRNWAGQFATLAGCVSVSPIDPFPENLRPLRIPSKACKYLTEAYARLSCFAHGFR